MQHRINSQFVMRRAHQLAAWNRAEKAPFGKWLRMAWAELRAGDFAGWTFDLPPVDPIAALEAQIDSMERCDRLGRQGLIKLGKLSRQLAGLHRAAEPLRLAA